MTKRRIVCWNGIHDLTVEENVWYDTKGRRRGCLPCRKASQARWRHLNGGYARKSRFKKEYGISVEEYDAMYEKQKGLCLICEKPGEKYTLAVDHDHQTGEVRGLLCRTCNSLLGFAKDSIPLLLRAIDYLMER